MMGGPEKLTGFQPALKTLDNGCSTIYWQADTQNSNNAIQLNLWGPEMQIPAVFQGTNKRITFLPDNVINSN
ncbi:hypothetical protein JOQ06_008028 [Pogonophryne albipinna]|uniref:Uncharacterized protein n=1 Tax=Pogonophryne albipinna TaxID=1090488 RepID=A0AAD6F9N4_9TELE|nr:hypothetical protein JOQ06_008028 [Pogonophryne albipinna]